ncbi:MoaD/ThiS family protein [Ammoniphilus sp. YIM 78166]|uniref:MoaD/ThiS family protein n=1 Tax=Ammoniphilus sp. YIM 78166 TaxID=1644106 RepID=UPI00143005E7|nr:MoaD/ThiS family protein [Ammoniphilus sp. YIM 78166]
MTGAYELTEPKTIQDFVESLGLTWNSDSLVVVNGIIVEEYYELKDGDNVQLLIPILGG